MAETEGMQSSQPPVENQEKKERIDELDVIGGLLLRAIGKGFVRVKQLFSPKKA
jgi:hypothetical protein